MSPAMPPTVLVVGDANPDLLLSGDVVPRFAQAEQEVSAAMTLGGSAGITAAALARLGVDVAIAAALGDDELGRLTAERLRTLHVRTEALQRSTRPTGLSVHLLRDDDRAILTSSGAIADLDVDEACRAIVAGVRHVHVASVFLVAPLRAGGERVVAAARAAGASVSVDTNFDPAGGFVLPSWVRDADVLLPNASEALAMTGRPADGDVESAARELAAGGAAVAVKLGAQGALAVSGPDAPVVGVAAPRAPAFVDAVGAGDAFDAGFVRGRLDGLPLADALALACAAGTLSVRDRGERGQATLEEAMTLAGLGARAGRR